MSITFDKRNYRKHSDSNKKKIKWSLQECGAGRSVLVDADGCLIAGNGVYEQAQALKIPTRVIETDGSELVVVKRTDLQTDDEKRKLLAMADNATSDNVERQQGNGNRLHHRINYRYLMPRVLRSINGRSNIPWDTYEEDYFTNEPLNRKKKKKNKLWQKKSDTRAKRAARVSACTSSVSRWQIRRATVRQRGRCVRSTIGARIMQRSKS